MVAAVARVDRCPELLAEVRQILWQRLFVGTPAQAPRILSYAGRGPLAAWIAVAAQRIALDLRRDAARLAGGDPEVEAVLPAREHPEIDYLRTRYKGEFEAAVRAALAALSDRERLLLRLTAVSGLSFEQVAAIYGVNQSTVSRWIARARNLVLEATEREICGKLGRAAVRVPFAGRHADESDRSQHIAGAGAVCRLSSSTCAARSGGQGLSTVIARRVEGWGNVSRCACSA